MCPLHMAWHDRDSVTDIYFTRSPSQHGRRDTEVHVTPAQRRTAEQSAKPTCRTGWPLRIDAGRRSWFVNTTVPVRLAGGAL